MKYGILVFSLFLIGCQSLPKNPEKAVEKQKNACLPSAIIMAEGLKKYNLWAKVLIAEWSDGKIKDKRNRGHAYTIYVYKNQTWAYDKDWGSSKIKSSKNNPEAVAIEANWSRNLISINLEAEYID